MLEIFYITGDSCAVEAIKESAIVTILPDLETIYIHVYPVFFSLFHLLYLYQLNISF